MRETRDRGGLGIPCTLVRRLNVRLASGLRRYGRVQNPVYLK